jgi:flagellar biosynthesis protein FliR
VDSILPSIRLDSLSDPWWQQSLPGAMQAFVAFILVATRLAGMVLIGPVFGHPGLSIPLRVLLVAAIALVLTPALLSVDAQRAFDRLDRDGDERLSLDEVSPSLHPQLRHLLAEAGKGDRDGLASHEFRLPTPVPRTLLDFVWLGLVELAVGLALGLGMTTMLSALLMAGSLIDQQLGLSTGEIFNPELGINVGLSGQILHQLGLIAFLVAGGHVLLVSALLDTFQTLPVGYAWLSPPMFDVLSDLVHQSLVLAMQVSAPVLAVMALVGLALGFLGRALPHLNVLFVGIPVRTLVGLLVLGLSLGGIGDRIGEIFPETVLRLRGIVMGASGGMGD